jgi:hypothetical protein
MLAFNVLMLVGWAYVLGAVAAAAVASAVVHGQVQSHKDFRIVVLLHAQFVTDLQEWGNTLSVIEAAGTFSHYSLHTK